MANMHPPAGPAADNYSINYSGPVIYRDPVDPDSIADGPVDQENQNKVFRNACLQAFIMSCGEEHYQNVLSRIRSLPMSWYKPENIEALWKQYESFVNDEAMIHTHTRGPNGYSKFLERTRYIERAIRQCELEAQGYFLPSMHSRATLPSSPLSRLQLSSHTLDILQQLHSRIQALEAYAISAHHNSY